MCRKRKKRASKNLSLHYIFVAPDRKRSMTKALLICVQLLGVVGALRIAPATALGRRAAIASAGVVAVSAPVWALPSRPTFVEARQDGKDDKAAAQLLKQVSFDDLVNKSRIRMEEELGRPMTKEELEALENKIRKMLGMDD